MILILGSGVIAKEIAASFISAGKDVLMTTTSVPKLHAGNLIRYDCRFEELTDIIDAASVNLIVNCAYSFVGDEVNRKINHALVKFKEQNKNVPCINISTLSAFSGARSQYGRAKYEHERFFAIYAIPSVRIGLPYSNPPIGLIATVKKISKILPFCTFAMSTPGAYTYITPMNALSNFLLNNHSKLEGVCSYVEPTPVNLVDLTRMMSNKLIIRINWRLLIPILQLFEFFKIKMRFGVDSVTGLIYSIKEPENNLYELPRQINVGHFKHRV